MLHRYKKERACLYCGLMTKDLFETDDSTLICGDCLEEEDNDAYNDHEEERP